VDIPLPTHRYVPGRSARHAEHAFDALKQVGTPLINCLAWKAGLRFLEAGYFWEAHEVWEAVWMAAPANSAEKCLVQGMIQLANAGLKRRMGRPRAAQRLDALAEGLLAESLARGGPEVMGLTPEDLDNARRRVTDVQYNAKSNLPDNENPQNERGSGILF
jgi:hypothetical protein